MNSATRERLETQHDELKRSYETLTKRIQALDLDIGREHDTEKKQTLVERRAERVSEREEVITKLEEVEQQLAGQTVVPPTKRLFNLPNATLNSLIDAVLSAGMATQDGRDSLLSGINPGFVAALPRRDSDLAQVRSDLEEVNKVRALAGGEVPLRIWLNNGETWLRRIGRSESQQFQQALKQMDEGGASWPTT